MPSCPIRKKRAKVRTRRPSQKTSKRHKGKRSRSTQMGLSCSGGRIRRSTIQDVDLSKLKEPKSMAGVTFHTYIKKLLRKVKPKLAINAESTSILDRLMKDTLHQIAVRAASNMGRRKVLVPKVIFRGMRQIMPKGFRLQADMCGKRALAKLARSKEVRR